jgi:hypothetical protein
MTELETTMAVSKMFDHDHIELLSGTPSFTAAKHKAHPAALSLVRKKATRFKLATPSSVLLGAVSTKEGLSN